MAKTTRAVYSIVPHFKGHSVGCRPPTYERKDGGVFYLTDELNQKDLGYLYEVIKYEGVTKSQTDTE